MNNHLTIGANTMKYALQVTGITHGWITSEVFDSYMDARRKAELAVFSGRKESSIRIITVNDDHKATY